MASSCSTNSVILLNNNKSLKQKGSFKLPTYKNPYDELIGNIYIRYDLIPTEKLKDINQEKVKEYFDDGYKIIVVDYYYIYPEENINIQKYTIKDRSIVFIVNTWYPYYPPEYVDLKKLYPPNSTYITFVFATKVPNITYVEIGISNKFDVSLGHSSFYW
jgi:hypothetical protein